MLRKIFPKTTIKNKKSTDFSKFFREAPSGEKKKVFLHVARKASKKQLDVIWSAHFARWIYLKTSWEQLSHNEWAWSKYQLKKSCVTNGIALCSQYHYWRLPFKRKNHQFYMPHNWDEPRLNQSIIDSLQKI